MLRFGPRNAEAHEEHARGNDNGGDGDCGAQLHGAGGNGAAGLQSPPYLDTVSFAHGRRLSQRAADEIAQLLGRAQSGEPGTPTFGRHSMQPAVGSGTHGGGSDGGGGGGGGGGGAVGGRSNIGSLQSDSGFAACCNTLPADLRDVEAGPSAPSGTCGRNSLTSELEAPLLEQQQQQGRRAFSPDTQSEASSTMVGGRPGQSPKQPQPVNRRKKPGVSRQPSLMSFS
eukprot:243897-Chlamydomonas_euryale.AAC.2